MDYKCANCKYHKSYFCEWDYVKKSYCSLDIKDIESCEHDKESETIIDVLLELLEGFVILPFIIALAFIMSLI